MTRALCVLVLVAACRDPEPPPPSAQPDPADLVRELERIRALRGPDREDEVARMMLGDTAWDRIIEYPFSRLFIQYASGFRLGAEPLSRALGMRGEITARRHYAGDPRLTPSQGRLRWALPVQYPSMVVEIAGRPVDTVFVHDATGWHPLEGLDDGLLRVVRNLDEPCATRLALAGPTGHCTDVGWAIADAALRGDQPAFTHACQLAASLCGTRSP